MNAIRKEPMAKYTLDINTSEDLPDVISELAMLTRRLLGHDSDTAKGLAKLYSVACVELKDIELSAGMKSDQEEYAAAHAR